MAELADALDSGSSARKGVEVRLLLSALFCFATIYLAIFWSFRLHPILRMRGRGLGRFLGIACGDRVVVGGEQLVRTSGGVRPGVGRVGR